MLFDIDYGIYLYVILLNIMVGGVVIGVGFGFFKFDYVLGIVKVYIMWVGLGLFFMELDCDVG